MSQFFVVEGQERQINERLGEVADVVAYWVPKVGWLYTYWGQEPSEGDIDPDEFVAYVLKTNPKGTKAFHVKAQNHEILAW